MTRDLCVCVSRQSNSSQITVFAEVSVMLSMVWVRPQNFMVRPEARENAIATLIQPLRLCRDTCGQIMVLSFSDNAGEEPPRGNPMEMLHAGMRTNHSEIARLVDSYLEDHPGHIDSLLIRAYIYACQSQFEKAYSLADQALKNCPKNDPDPFALLLRSTYTIDDCQGTRIWDFMKCWMLHEKKKFPAPRTLLLHLALSGFVQCRWKFCEKAVKRFFDIA